MFRSVFRGPNGNVRMRGRCNELSFEVEEFDDLESKAAIKKYMGKKQNIR